eukprot:761028-Hanusia_phi.AAC.2
MKIKYPNFDLTFESDNQGCLPDLADTDQHKRTLVLDLDETLVHTEFNVRSIHDVGRICGISDHLVKFCSEMVYPEEATGWITHRRPGVSSFLAALGDKYEIVCFTSGLREYASPIIDQLDMNGIISHRLFREHTRHLKGLHVKDLSWLNRNLAKTIIVDNSPESYLMQPENAIPIKPFFGDTGDTALLELIPFLLDIVDAAVDDVRTVRHKEAAKNRKRCSRSKAQQASLPMDARTSSCRSEAPSLSSEADRRRHSDINDACFEDCMAVLDGLITNNLGALTDVSDEFRDSNSEVVQSDQLPQDLFNEHGKGSSDISMEHVLLKEAVNASWSTGDLDDLDCSLDLRSTSPFTSNVLIPTNAGRRWDEICSHSYDEKAHSKPFDLLAKVNLHGHWMTSVVSGRRECLIDLSALNGSLVDVMKGMSPPPSFNLMLGNSRQEP